MISRPYRSMSAAARPLRRSEAACWELSRTFLSKVTRIAELRNTLCHKLDNFLFSKRARHIESPSLVRVSTPGRSTVGIRQLS